MTPKNVAVAGATGVVGRQLLHMLDVRNFPIKSLKLLASERSAGQPMTFKGETIPAAALRVDSFKRADVALFSAGGGTSKKFAPCAAADGCVVVDNSSAWRMDPEVPLVVPEVNAHAIKTHKGIIANPNCSTIQMVVVLKPLHDAATIKRIVVSTYQAVSGAGKEALNELEEQMRASLAGEEVSCNVFVHPMAFNVVPAIPHKNSFEPNGYTNEEMKMVNETKKIMGDNNIRVTATTVRVPVRTGHSESVNIETARKLGVAEARELLAKAPGVTLMDDPANNVYPTPLHAADKQTTFVGRLREDISIDNGLDMWIVSDNLLKGAALNAVEIAELL